MSFPPAVRVLLLVAVGVLLIGVVFLRNFSRPGHPTLMSQPVGYFEIPVQDLNRAIQFYQATFGYTFTRTSIDGNEMALFPAIENAPGITGALAKGPTYVPSLTGSLVYFNTRDLDALLTRAQAQGGKVLYPKTSIGELGFVAEIQDSEGNRIGLHAPQKP